MLDQQKVKEVAERFLNEGMGLVIMTGLIEDGDLSFKCFSTVSKNDVYSVMETVASNVAMMPFDLSSLMNGDFVAVPPIEKLKELAQWGADYLEREEPLIVACVSEGVFAAFAVGDAPMLVYIAVRMLTTLRRGGTINMNPFVPSMN